MNHNESLTRLEARKVNGTSDDLYRLHVVERPNT